MIDFNKLFEEKDIEYIQFQFTTILGELKTVEFPTNIWDDMKDGTGVDGSSLGFLLTEQSDMKAVPDYSTFTILPWEPRVGRFICDLKDDKGQPHPTDPRGILRKVIAQAEEMGYEYKTRPELEFIFLDSEGEPLDDGGYMDTGIFDPLSELRREITDDMLDIGIGVKTIHHECAKGQHEIEFTVLDALHQADNVQTAKLIAKTRAMLNGVICTFMPKPYLNDSGSGLHIHQYLTKDGENIFAGEKAGEVSEILRYFVGGILKHTSEITAFLNPTTNSYRRLKPGHEAPVFKAWGVANRTALIRVPGYEKKARIEYRAADGATNIYIASALLLAAGLDGVKNKIEPIEPTKKNVENLTEDERNTMGIEMLPSTLEEAINIADKSEFARQTLGNEFVDIFIREKRKEIAELKKINAKNEEEELEWEYEKYLERV